MALRATPGRGARNVGPPARSGTPSACGRPSAEANRPPARLTQRQWASGQAYSPKASGDWYHKSDGRIRQMERYGSQWSIGVKGDY